MTEVATNTVLRVLEKNRTRETVRLRLVTDLDPLALGAGATDLSALMELLQKMPLATVTHLPRLHAKTYVIDSKHAVVTSANLTRGGLSLNYEFGVCISEVHLVAQIRREAESYAALGGDVSRDSMKDLCQAAESLVDLRRRAEHQVSASLKRALREQMTRVQLGLFHVRASGKTTHGIFADTLLYLLASGPRRTVDLHRMVQTIHPDLCDDSVDRVIDGVHFGKRWKHFVRMAQQHLKRRGFVARERDRWYRTDRTPGTSARDVLRADGPGAPAD